MLIGVNALGQGTESGVGHGPYFRIALATMRKIQPDTHFVIFTDPDNHDSFDGWERERIEDAGALGLIPGVDSPLEHAAKKWNVDVLFSPIETAPSRTSIPLVLLALELRCWEKSYLKTHRRQAVRLRSMKRLCAHAAAIVVPSEFIRRKFLELLRIPLNKTVVALPGVDPAFDHPQPCLAEQPYLLLVGDTVRHNNTARFMGAYHQLCDEFAHNLVVVGRAGESEPEDWGSRIIRIEQCPVGYLAGLYQHCGVYVQPALYDGSAVTLLEAMRAGALMASSRVGAVPEIANDIPYFFNPESVTSMISTIRRVIEEDPAQRQARARYSRQVASEYTWEKCAWKVLSAFKRV